MKKVLYLPLKTKWYRMIESGEKPEEYREITPYWCKRLLLQENMFGEYKPINIDSCYTVIVDNLKQRFFSGDIIPVDYDEIMFSLGYPASEDSTRHILKDITEITIGMGNPKWGAPDHDVFIIKFKI